MPVLIKVGVSRKLSRDYNSQGYTLDIQSELPANATQDPQAMAEAADELFRLAEDLIEAQVGKADRSSDPSPAYRQDAPRQARGGARGSQGNGSGQSYRPGGAPSPSPRNNESGQGNGQGGGRGITDAQARALEKMARVVDTTAERVAMDEYGVRVRDLSVKQASALIDQLKQSIEAQRGGGVR